MPSLAAAALLFQCTMANPALGIRLCQLASLPFSVAGEPVARIQQAAKSSFDGAGGVISGILINPNLGSPSDPDHALSLYACGQELFFVLDYKMSPAEMNRFL